MKTNNEELVHEFKRFIHVLSMGRRTPINFGETKLYRAEVHILELIGAAAGITATDLAKKLSVTKGAVSQIIRKLTSKELIQKKSLSKSHELSVTQKGAMILKTHHTHEEALLTSINKKLEGLSAKDIATFSEIVHEVTDFIKK